MLMLIYLAPLRMRLIYNLKEELTGAITITRESIRTINSGARMFDGAGINFAVGIINQIVAGLAADSRRDDDNDHQSYGGGSGFGGDTPFGGRTIDTLYILGRCSSIGVSTSKYLLVLVNASLAKKGLKELITKVEALMQAQKIQS